MFIETYWNNDNLSSNDFVNFWLVTAKHEKYCRILVVFSWGGPFLNFSSQLSMCGLCHPHFGERARIVCQVNLVFLLWNFFFVVKTLIEGVSAQTWNFTWIYPKFSGMKVRKLSCRTFSPTLAMLVVDMSGCLKFDTCYYLSWSFKKFSN